MLRQIKQFYRGKTLRGSLKGLAWRLWYRLIARNRYRISTSVSLSILIHTLFVMGYFSLSALEPASDPPIREITFVDLTEEENKPEVIKQRESRPVNPRIAQNEPQEPEVVKSAASAPLALGSDRIFLDSPRKQAPINVKQFEPVAEVSLAKDKISVSPAIGIKKDDKVSKPQALDLGSSRERSPALASQTTGAVSIDPGNKPTIDLKPGRISAGSGEAVTGDFKTAPPQPVEKELLLEKQETQTVITGVLANREILKKVVPPFPKWAKMQGVSAAISLRFTVMENGTVKENVIIERTSGSLQWDQIVISALKNWQFAPLPKQGVREDQTGVITFKFVI